MSGTFSSDVIGKVLISSSECLVIMYCLEFGGWIGRITWLKECKMGGGVGSDKIRTEGV